MKEGIIMKDLKEMVDQLNDNALVPLLKDTIADNNKHNKRLFITNIVLSLVVLIISITSMILVSLQSKQYADFLSQFEFESDTVYQSTNDNSDINDGIRIMK